MNSSPKRKLKEIIIKDKFLRVNRKMIGLIGLNNSVLLSYLLFKDNLSDGKFFVTRKKITEDTGLKQWVQKSALTFLKLENFISVMKEGIPPKNWFIINYNNIIGLIEKESIKIEDKPVINNRVKKSVNIVTALFEKVINIKNKYEERKLQSVIKKITDYYFSIPREDKQGRPVQLLNFLVGRAESPKKFCVKYICWLEDQYKIKKSFISLSDIGPESNSWTLFIKQTLQEIGAEIRTKKTGEKYMWVISI